MSKVARQIFARTALREERGAIAVIVALFMVALLVLAALVLDRVRQVFGVALTPDQLFEAPAVSALAAEIERGQMSPSK